ncbi:hypothetical protein AYI68_g947 [Smittium mucronatum]|uniref:Uncharacterized protein n=1 Tax=Smittium mucronatum TaxID=133383 RepID=A0A1R0H6S3_9FUNG|nr:hypothetical protein AYI68_g947 [Smittium mucronatum]
MIWSINCLCKLVASSTHKFMFSLASPVLLTNFVNSFIVGNNLLAASVGVKCNSLFAVAHSGLLQKSRLHPYTSWLCKVRTTRLSISSILGSDSAT